MGYFQSKFAAEKLLEEARRRGFSISIYRPGYIAGDSASGLEAEEQGQIFFSFLRGCIELGKVPQLDKVLDVVPVDYVARAITALSFTPGAQGRSFNLINPSPMKQRDLYQALRERGYPLREVPYPLWREEILALPRTQPENPLSRFAVYYQGLDEQRMRHLERQTANEDEEYRVTRTTIPTFLEALFILPRNIGYHIEHHWYPSVPFYRLPDLHLQLMRQPGFSSKANIKLSVRKALRDCTS